MDIAGRGTKNSGASASVTLRYNNISCWRLSSLFAGVVEGERAASRPSLCVRRAWCSCFARAFISRTLCWQISTANARRAFFTAPPAQNIIAAPHSTRQADVDLDVCGRSGVWQVRRKEDRQRGLIADLQQVDRTCFFLRCYRAAAHFIMVRPLLRVMWRTAYRHHLSCACASPVVSRHCSDARATAAW